MTSLNNNTNENNSKEKETDSDSKEIKVRALDAEEDTRSSSSSSASSSSSSSTSNSQAVTSKTAARNAAKLVFRAEKGPFPFQKKVPSLSSNSSGPPIKILELTKDGSRMVNCIPRLKNDFYPIAFDTLKKEVLFQAINNEYYTRENEASLEYKHWLKVRKQVKSALEINQKEQKSLKEKSMDEGGYSEEMKNQRIALEGEEVVLVENLKEPAIKPPAHRLEAISIVCEMRLPFGTYDFEDDGKVKFRCNISISYSSSSSSSSSLSSSASSSAIATSERSADCKPCTRLSTTCVHDEERMEYKVQVDAWDKTIHHVPPSSHSYISNKNHQICFQKSPCHLK